MTGDGQGAVYLVGGEERSMHPEPSAYWKTRGAPYRRLWMPTPSVEVYHIHEQRWEVLPSMKYTRRSPGAAVGKDGKLYVFGGCNCSSYPHVNGNGLGDPDPYGEQEVLEAKRSVAATEIYDPKTKTWSEGAPMPIPRQDIQAQTGADGRIYVIGGLRSFADRSRPDVDIYDPETDTWSKGPDLQVPRHGHASVVTSTGEIWVIGGYWHYEGPKLDESQSPKPGPQATVEILDTRPPARSP